MEVEIINSTYIPAPLPEEICAIPPPESEAEISNYESEIGEKIDIIA
ncbi:MAG: hypothetical protein KAT05_15775 [Spirochaetes bacterium]|nr:hypothetical protein [Spirochaetota bacterium]